MPSVVSGNTQLNPILSFQNIHSITNSKQSVLNMSENVEDKPNPQRTLQPSLQQKKSLPVSSMSLVGGDRELSSLSSSSEQSTPSFDDEEEEVKRSVFTSAFAEFFATFLFLFFICFGPTMQTKPDDFEVSFIVAISRGCCMALAIPFGAGSLNPAITITLMATNNISPFGGFLFLLAEIFGAIGGASLAHYTMGADSFRGPIHLQNGFSINQGFIGEMVGSAVLVSVVMFTLIHSRHGEQTDGKRTTRRFSPVFVSLCMFLLHLGLVDITGCGVNPVRALGPAMVSGEYNQMGMYMIAPIFGAAASIGLSICLFGRVNPHDEAEEDHDLEEGDEEGRHQRRMERARRRCSIAHNNLKSPRRSLINASSRSIPQEHPRTPSLPTK